MPELTSLTGSRAEAQRQDPITGGHFHYDTLKSLGRITEGLAERGIEGKLWAEESSDNKPTPEWWSSIPQILRLKNKTDFGSCC